ncbi:MAG: cupredoxin domain-containing protein [Candidatus Micrarchaeota archaeon]
MKALTFLILVSAIAFGFIAIAFATTSNVVQNPDSGTALTGQQGQGVQDIYIKAKADGTYDKNLITVSSGSLVRLHFSTEPGVGCGQLLVIQGLNVRVNASPGNEQIVEFTPTQKGSYTYTCGMGMWGPGTLIVQ